MLRRKIIVKGVPLQKQSAKFFRRGNFVGSYQPKKITEWSAQARLQIIEQLPFGHIPETGKIVIEKLHFYFPPLKNWSKKKLNLLRNGEKIYKDTAPDIDNLQKSLYDVCNDIIWIDDRQIVHVKEICKLYSEVPRIELIYGEIE